MKELFHFDSPPEAYSADAVVLSCLDERIRLVVNKFLRRQKILHPDMIVVAGGAKNLVSPRNESDRDFILEQVRISIKYHQASRIYLMTHSDCAAYGGLAAFGGERNKEAAHHERELLRAAEFVKSTFPGLAPSCFFVSFDGVNEVESATSG